MKTPDAGTHAATRSLQQYPVKTVTVHRFLIPHVGFRENLAYTFYATREAIVRFRGTVVTGTALEVNESVLDENGVYDPARYTPGESWL